MLLTVVFTARAQQASMILGPDEIAENQIWTITLTISNEQLRNYEAFPEIAGFKKRGASTQSQTSVINGQMSSTYSVIMNYQPLKQGVIVVPPLTLKINGHPVSSPGKKVKVNPPSAVQARDPFRGPFDQDPFEEFFGGRKQTEFIDVKEDAFLAVTTNKDEVYVGEGFTATLSFFVGESNKAPLQFHELGEQLTDILKKLRPSACWEENFNIENIEGERIEIGGKDYTQYRIYQAAYYPLGNTPINFPSVGLRMIKFKVAKNPSFFGQNRQEDFKTFYSKPKTVRVKQLPPHPLRESVAVGKYRLTDKLSVKTTETGRSIGYDFIITGEGNISGIPNPQVQKDHRIEFFDPNVRQNITRQSGRVGGSKNFSFFLIPQEPGIYDLGKRVFMVYFDPVSKKYDTLRSSRKLEVTGQSMANQLMANNDVTSFYDRISESDNTLSHRSDYDYVRLLINGFILLALGASVYLAFKKPNL
ncbi:MAG: BatD family protein [Cyclobacteriaceae bacterium]